jgi:tetratricopeptide (TPR) repeat protein
MKCVCLPKPDAHGSTAVDHVRLFRNRADVRWKYRVHEQILPAVRKSGGGVCFTDIVIHHVGYQDEALRRRKLERDLRLLRMEYAETRDEPFILFNLGCVFAELEQWREALAMCQRSLERSAAGDSIVRKLYAQIVQCHRHLQEPGPASAVCQAGRKLYPDDCELLFLEGLLLREQGQHGAAEQRFLQLLTRREGAHFASVDEGLHGYKARHNLAVVYAEQGRFAEAEAHWRAVLEQEPSFVPARTGLERLLAQRGLVG